MKIVVDGIISLEDFLSAYIKCFFKKINTPSMGSSTRIIGQYIETATGFVFPAEDIHEEFVKNGYLYRSLCLPGGENYPPINNWQYAVSTKSLGFYPGSFLDECLISAVVLSAKCEDFRWLMLHEHETDRYLHELFYGISSISENDALRKYLSRESNINLINIYSAAITGREIEQGIKREKNAIHSFFTWRDHLAKRSYSNDELVDRLIHITHLYVYILRYMDCAMRNWR